MAGLYITPIVAMEFAAKTVTAVPPVVTVNAEGAMGVCFVGFGKEDREAGIGTPPVTPCMGVAVVADVPAAVGVT